jgi:predicted kinase
VCCLRNSQYKRTSRIFGLAAKPEITGSCARLPSHALPGTRQVCYKPFMRKWMRERMKRRKSSPPKETQPAEASQAPLQPAYFDAPSEPQQAEPEPRVEAAAEPKPEAAAQQPMVEAATGVPEPPTRRRRRRGRGGRGRSGARAATQAPVQPTLIPEGTERQPAPQPAAPAAAAPVDTTPRKPKGVVVLAIGLPGSGKSSWFKRHNISPLSSDTLRQLLFDDPTEQRFQDLVFSNLRSMLKARLIARRPMNYVDATNLSIHDRQGWIKMARDFGYEVHGVYFDVPVEVCLERNQRRQRVVPEDVMRRMASKLRPPTFEEGFAKITVVRVKKKEEDSEPAK